MSYSRLHVQPLHLLAFSLLIGAPIGDLFAKLDQNANTLSDIWESAFPPALTPQADEDFDGFTNLAESTAGTDPRDSSDFPRGPVLHLPHASQVMHTWMSQRGVAYQTWASADLRQWMPVGIPLIGTGGEMEHSFDLDYTFSTGGVRLRRWTELSNWGINNFKSVITNGTPASSERVMTRLEIPQSEPDADNYGQYIQGWLVPPHSGEYTFSLASDDSSELWLSADASTSQVTMVASVSGWTAPQEWDKYPSQQSSTITLQAGQSYYFELFHFEGSGGDHLALAWEADLAGEPLIPQQIISGSALSSSGVKLRDMSDDGSLFFRHQILELDSDNDGLTDYEEGILGTDPLNATTTPRKPDLEVAQTALVSPSVVSIGIDQSRAYEVEQAPARLRIFRSGGIGPVTVPLSFTGSAALSDYSTSADSVHFSAGSREASVDIFPTSDAEVEAPESVTITLSAGADYIIGNPSSATVTIDDARDILYLAQLRSSDALRSRGAGHAIIRQAGNGLSSELTLHFSGLSASQTSAEIVFSANGYSGETVYTFPLNQVESLTWDLSGSNGMTPSQVAIALSQGQLWIRIASSDEPTGELVGRLMTFSGSQSMPPVATPPTAEVSASGDSGEVARFLTQATFGASPASVQAFGAQTYANWIDTQIALPASFHFASFQAWQQEYLSRRGNDGFQTPRRLAWWDASVNAPDQLRQRMAFALSQILVISQNGGLDGSHEGVTQYYDTLLTHAFGNYRDLLEEVTLSPMMGRYLSMMRNRKPDPETGHEPDENYAREIMQLFSIGLMQRHLDGSVKLDNEGRPLPTYTQKDIVELAHIFTGWSSHYDELDPPLWSNGDVASRNGWFLYGRDDMRPMSMYPEYHDTADRQFLNSPVLPGTMSGEDRMQAALDTLFNHPNVAPFVATQLIQKFVTSNPSPGYVYRVAQAFEDNGVGVRGDLGATIRAVLLDFEARNFEVRESITYGRGLEPILRFSRMLRALPLIKPLPNDERLAIDLAYDLREQVPLNAPSVFNFYEPSYASPGAISDAGVVSPEFQLFAETTAISQANRHNTILSWGIWTFIEEDYFHEESGEIRQRAIPLRIDYDALAQQLATLGDDGDDHINSTTEIDALIDYYDTYLLYGNMTPQLQAAITTAFSSLPTWYDNADQDVSSRNRERIRMSAYIVLTSPEYFVQR